MTFVIEREDGLIFVTSADGHFACVDSVEKLCQILTKWFAPREGEQ